jgi:hypothetical protein
MLLDSLNNNYQMKMETKIDEAMTGFIENSDNDLNLAA